MARKSAGKACWFKVFSHQKSFIDAIPNENAGIALKAAMSYLENDDVIDLDPLSFALFSSFKQYIDESRLDFQKFSEAGQRGNRKRWDKEVSPPDTTQSPPDTTYHDTLSTNHYSLSTNHENESRNIVPDKPAARSSFLKPSVDDVKAYCNEKGYSINAEYFVDYYESNGWMVGKNKMKDWKASVRMWASRDQKKEEPVKKLPPAVEAYGSIPILGYPGGD